MLEVEWILRLDSIGFMENMPVIRHYNQYSKILLCTSVKYEIAANISKIYRYFIKCYQSKEKK